MSPILVEELPAGGVLTLQVRPVVSESVTVTGGAPTIDASPASATTSLPREEIATRHPARLTDVLANVAGAGSLSDLHASVPSLRGLARGRTLLLIDGARVTTERRLGPSASFLDPFFLEGVEVARGPGSVGYGSDAFGGVIHARTPSVEPGSPTRARARGAVGAGLPERTAGIELTHGLDEGGVLVQARYRDFESYASPEGVIPNSQATDKGLLGRFTHKVGPGSLTAGWQSGFLRNMGRPDNRGDAVTTTQDETSHRLTVSYDLSPVAGFTRAGIQGFWGRYEVLTERVTSATRRAPASFSMSDVGANDFSFRSFGVRPVGRARWELGVDVNGRYGLQTLNSFRFDDPTEGGLADIEEVSVDSARRLDLGLYTSTEVSLSSALSLGAALRFDRVTTANEGGFFGDRSTANAAVSGYGSLKLELGHGLSLTAQLARGFRDPTLSDRYFRGLGGRGIVTGNPDLEPEIAKQFDTSLRFVRGGTRWALYGYFYRLLDLVERYEAAPDLFSFRNQGEADIKGIEVEMQTGLPSSFTLELSAAIAKGQTRETAEPIDDISANHIKMVLRRAFLQRGYTQLRVATFFENSEPGPTEVNLAGYTTVDVGAGWRFSPQLELRAVVRNLFDKAYPISRDARAVLAPGINGVVTIVAGF